MASKENPVKKVLLLGGSGFIGTHLQESLNSRGIPFHSPSSREIDLRTTESQEILKQLVDRETVVLFAAAIVRERGDNIQTCQDNINIALNVASVLKEVKVAGCVYCSTTDVYGQPERLPITENTPLDPKTYYAVAKLASEMILKTTVENFGFSLLIVRYPGVFGPSQKGAKYGPNAFIESIIKDNEVSVWGDGKEKRNFLYVKDLSKLISLLMFCRVSGTVNIATGIDSSFAEVLDQLKTAIAIDFKIVHKDRTGTTFNQTFDIQKLRSLLGNVPLTDPKIALLETYNSILEKQ